MESHNEIIAASKALAAKVAKLKAIVDRIESFDRDYQNISKDTTTTKHVNFSWNWTK